MTPGKATKKLLIGGVFSIAMLMNAGCAESRESEETQTETAQTAERTTSMSREERLAMRQELESARQIEKVAQEDLERTTGGVTGEVPDDLLEKIFADLEKQTGARRSEFKVLHAEERQWNDGALGCPEPGQVYTQAIVDGYQVIIDHNGKSFDYHASVSGFFKLCTGFLPNR